MSAHLLPVTMDKAAFWQKVCGGVGVLSDLPMTESKVTVGDKMGLSGRKLASVNVSTYLDKG